MNAWHWPQWVVAAYIAWECYKAFAAVVSAVSKSGAKLMRASPSAAAVTLVILLGVRAPLLIALIAGGFF